MYVLIGVLTVPIALSSGGSTGDSASRSGAIGKIAESPFGQVALFVIAIGLGLYSRWRLTTAVLPGDNTLETWGHRSGPSRVGHRARLPRRHRPAGCAGRRIQQQRVRSRRQPGRRVHPGGRRDDRRPRAGRHRRDRCGRARGMFIVRGVQKKFLERLDLGHGTEAERQTTREVPRTPAAASRCDRPGGSAPPGSGVRSPGCARSSANRGARAGATSPVTRSPAGWHPWRSRAEVWPQPSPTEQIATAC